ncbi:MAG: hypothetical protein K0U98_24540 [Deltaproteobacteria bacterium]|nr:hypothetical protein [Deltaproteobacteria bacterium]
MRFFDRQIAGLATCTQTATARGATLFGGLLLLLASFSQPLLGQDDTAAGLFCEARQLPLISQSLTVRINDGGAVLDWIQIFVNDGEAAGQADYRVHLPSGATIEDFGFWRGETFLAAQLKERAQARREHQRAAAKGKATGLAESKGEIHSFSVFPVPAGEKQQVRVRLRLPITTERGRNSLRLPLDELLGQEAVSAAVVVEIETEEPLKAFGLDGGESLQTLDQGEHWATLFTATHRPLDLWWAEQAPPLLTRAEAVPLGDGRYGLQLRLALNDAGGWATPAEELILLVDASYSVRRRAASLINVADRVLQHNHLPLRVIRVTDGGRIELSPRDRQELLTSLLEEGDHLSTGWQSLVDTAQAYDCASPRRRCLAVTDPQVNGLQRERPEFLRTLFLADAHELDFFANLLGEEAATFLVGTDPKAKLTGLVDEMVRPVLKVRGWQQEGTPLKAHGPQRHTVAEGGLLRLFAIADSVAGLDLDLSLAGSAVPVEVLPELLSADSRQGKAVRHGVFRNLLAQWMADYRRHRDPALKAQIIELSLAEAIPTAFTSLHVADPSLSLSAIKPGDPLLQVPAEPGLVEVVAWYPFGELRKLVYDADSQTFSDRFLVPRGWEDRGYRIEIFKRFDDGHHQSTGIWYQLDDLGPEAQFYLRQGHLQIDTGEATQTIGAVEVHLPQGQVYRLSPLGHRWAVEVSQLPRQFTVVLRDRAGNRSRYRLTLIGDHLEAQRLQPPTTASRAIPSRASTSQPEPRTANSLASPNSELTVSRDDGSSFRFAVHDLDLHSRNVLSTTRVADNQMLLGTSGGDLVRLHCRPGESLLAFPSHCQARSVSREFAHHPITGLAPLASGRTLVAVLGQGLFELHDGELNPSSYRVGSRFVTAVARLGREVFVATAYNGLWRLVDGRAIQCRFPQQHITSLEVTPRGLEITSGSRLFLRHGRDRFTETGVATVPPPPRSLTSAVTLGDGLLAGAFDGGLIRIDARGSIQAVKAGLSIAQRRINALRIVDESLWIASEGGLLRLPLSPGGEPLGPVEVIVDAASHALTLTPWSLVAATTQGLLEVRQPNSAGYETRPLGGQSAASSASFGAVAWFAGELYAGGLEGLFRLENGVLTAVGMADGFDGGWVTALLADGDRLLVGTYDRGVYALDGEHFSPLKGLEEQWVPPGALARLGDDLWVGGLGMAPVRLNRDGNVERLRVPVRDVQGFVAGLAGEIHLLTSEGLVSIPSAMPASALVMHRRPSGI